MKRRRQSSTSRAPVARRSTAGHLLAGATEPLHWYVQTFTGDAADPPALWHPSRAAARAAARALGAQPGPGNPRRAGAQPVVRVDVLFGASELAEVDRARGKTARQRWIRDAALERARRER